MDIMISNIEFCILVIVIVLLTVNLAIAIYYEKYFKDNQDKLTYLRLSRRFAKDYPVIGTLFVWTVYLMLSAIPILFLLMMSKYFILN